MTAILNQLRNLSIISFILANQIKTEKGEVLNFRDRLFLLDILRDWSKEIVIKKCSQIGGSVVFNLKALFAARVYRWDIIYTMPSDSDVEEFVKTKTNPIISANLAAFPTSSDSVYLKQIGGRNVHYKGTISKTAAIATTADLLIHDEASRSDQKTLDTYKSRTKASPFKGRWVFSNPTTEKDLVDEQWRKSDQKEWVVSCKKCKLEQYLNWPESIDPLRKCYQCKGCSAELTREDRRVGKWVAQSPEGTVSGYHISHLMAPWITAEEILEDSEADQEYFYNFVLGEPYNPGNLRVSKSTILDNWTPEKLDTGRWFLGVDVGNIKHFCLGSEKGITQVGRFFEWHELDKMMEMYKPTLVIDAMPENDVAKHYVEKFPAAYMCYLNRDRDAKRWLRWGENHEQGVIHADRNRAIDRLIAELLAGNILVSAPINKDFRDYLKQWETLRQVKEVNTLGIERYVWDSTTGNDHGVFSTLFYHIATLSHGDGKLLIGGAQKGAELITTTSAGPTIANLKELMEDPRFHDD